MDWSALLSVVTINLLLSSDNALAIAMASRKLAPEYRRTAIRWGSICAIVIQISMTYMASLLLNIQFLKIIGGIVLAWIALKMVCGDNSEETEDARSNRCSGIYSAVRLITAANVVMCLDNVLAVAAVAGSDPLILGIGILVSFPIIMGGSSIVAGLLEKYPVLIWLGSVFLGWTAGGIIASEGFLIPILHSLKISHTSISALVALGISFIAWRQAVAKAHVAE